MGYNRDMFLDGAVIDSMPGLSCGVCKGVVEQPTETPCGHVFCAYCIRNALQVRSICPVCGKHVLGGTRESPVIQNMLNSLRTRCLQCGWTGTFATHIRHNCQTVQPHNPLNPHPVRPPPPTSEFTPVRNSVAQEAADFFSQLSTYRQKDSGRSLSSASAPVLPRVSTSYRTASPNRNTKECEDIQVYTESPVRSSVSSGQSQPILQRKLHFPAVQHEPLQTGSKRICRNCGGHGSSRKIGEDGYCDFCRKYG